MDAVYHTQSFETELLGVPVGRLTLPEEENDASAEGNLAALTAGWRADGVWLVSCRVTVGSPLLANLEERGFRAVETLLTLRNTLADTPEVADVEIAGPGDHEACLAIAELAFTNDRLHRDPEVPDWVADTVRRAWVMNDLTGRGDASFVARDGGVVAGFNLCMMRGNEAVIDLIAVDPSHQNKGLGRRLVDGALAHYRGRAAAMRVGTQADNKPSIALYQGAGFVEATRQTTLHWINPDATPDAAGVS